MDSSDDNGPIRGIRLKQQRPFTPAPSTASTSGTSSSIAPEEPLPPSADLPPPSIAASDSSAATPAPPAGENEEDSTSDDSDAPLTSIAEKRKATGLAVSSSSRSSSPSVTARQKNRPAAKRSPLKPAAKRNTKAGGKAASTGSKKKPAASPKNKPAAKGLRAGRANDATLNGKENGEVEPRGTRRRGAVKKQVKEEKEEEILVPGDARKYFKDGQKHITPPNGDGTRAFYESLYDEVPNSLIAIKFCVEFGVLTGTKHHTALAKFEALKQMGAYKGLLGGIKPELKNGSRKRLLQLEH